MKSTQAIKQCTSFVETKSLTFAVGRQETYLSIISTMKTYSRKKNDDNSEIILNLDELCRLCLTKEDELIPIFNEEEPIPLTLRIVACVSLEVSIFSNKCKIFQNKWHSQLRSCKNKSKLGVVIDEMLLFYRFYIPLLFPYYHKLINFSKNIFINLTIFI